VLCQTQEKRAHNAAKACATSVKGDSRPRACGPRNFRSQAYFARLSVVGRAVCPYCG
jgi:hypothetical protein